MRKIIVLAVMLFGWVVALVVASGGPTTAQDATVDRLSAVETAIADLRAQDASLIDKDRQLSLVRPIPNPNPTALSGPLALVPIEPPYAFEMACKIRQSAAQIEESWVLDCSRFGDGLPGTVP